MQSSKIKIAITTTTAITKYNRSGKHAFYEYFKRPKMESKNQSAFQITLI